MYLDIIIITCSNILILLASNCENDCKCKQTQPICADVYVIVIYQYILRVSPLYLLNIVHGFKQQEVWTCKNKHSVL